MTFTVMTWNVENVFPPGPESPGDAAGYEAKLRYVAGVLRASAPDVVALQELGGPAVLDDLVALLGPGWSGAVTSELPDERGIRVGLLARHPLDRVVHLGAFPPGSRTDLLDPDGVPMAAFGRGALQAELLLPGLRMRLLTAHLKSRRPELPAGVQAPVDDDERALGIAASLLRRTAEATALRVHLNRVMRDAPMPTVLLGDLNDGPGALTTRLLEGPDESDPRLPDGGDGARLYNLASRLPSGRAYTLLYRGQRDLVDHLLVSRDLLFGVEQVEALVDGLDRAAFDGAVPDHAPLRARFRHPR